VGATHAEKSTISAGQLNSVPSGGGMVGGGLSALDKAAAQAQAMLAAQPATDIKFCGVDDPTCEACQ
jgi:ribonucleoside-diphosphate reductase alpha chain